ncbi:MSMEG_6728 family protein [Microbispora sp. NPDC049125]|uniref:MSMEG_6728 family protein n=1 Tax=Microbispora sp. NPDC049125 TaxID=3154929 RepID=UPI003467515A
MQTFLPYPDFAASARVLDPRRLGKQRVETLQVLRALTVPGYGWRHHPAARMWTGYEEALVRYGLEICGAWCAMGRADTCAATMTRELLALRDATFPSATGSTSEPSASEVPGDHSVSALPRSQIDLAAAGELPPWLGDPALHVSHRSALLRKDPDFYGPLFPGDPDDLPYVWPASDRQGGLG